MQNVECKKILTYPPGRGGITINTYDYMCLGSDNYLNDVIIDFYLKYIHTELIDDQQRAKSHIFSQFFYKRLTTMNKEKDNRNQTAAQKRHARVSTWTKNVNLFEKDFIIVPINEQSHWFLAIICFPNLTEPRTMDTDQPIKLVTAVKKQSELTFLIFKIN
jgi:sentrin-specific protease 7